MAAPSAPPEIRDLRSLLYWLADSRHGGAFYPIAKRVGVSPALVHQWKDGLTRYPRVDTLLRLCDAYGLEPAWVLGLIRLHSGRGGAGPQHRVAGTSDKARSKMRRNLVKIGPKGGIEEALCQVGGLARVLLAGARLPLRLYRWEVA